MQSARLSSILSLKGDTAMLSDGAVQPARIIMRAIVPRVRELGASCESRYSRGIARARREGEERKRREAAYTLPARRKVLVPIWRSMMDYTAARVKNLHPRNKLSARYCLEREFYTRSSPPLRRIADRPGWICDASDRRK